mgnify:CR=1 FL=1
MKGIIPSVKGTRDLYPQDMAVRSWLYGIIRRVSESYGYQEYEAPFIEKLDLYAAKSGEELVKEQAFVFPDRGGDLITLRPELTLSLARMVAQKQRELIFPLRWWSFGPFWRYERPQKGRTREFFQWNIDLIGPSSPECDAELVTICAAFFKAVGLSSRQVGIQVNNRRLMDSAMAGLDIVSEIRPVVNRLIDRRDKMRPEEWDSYGLEIGLNSRQLDGLKGLMKNSELWKQSEELRRFFIALEAMGLSEYVHFDASIIRGLDYYTGIVFEARELDLEGRAILGGGHYDNLVADVGGDPLPGVGFAMGDVMIGLVLEKYGLIPAYQPATAPVLVTLFDEARMTGTFKFCAMLRNAGVGAAMYPELAKLPKQFKYADRIGARFVAILGPDEDLSGQVTIKDLSVREQVTFSQSDAVAWIKGRLAQE